VDWTLWIPTGILPAPICLFSDKGCDGGSDDPIQDDPRLEDYNVESRVGGFLEIVAAYMLAYTGDDILITMGADFLYENSHSNFKQMDKIIKYGNQMAQDKMILKYSTPQEYTQAKLSSGLEWSVTQSDLLSYSDSPHAYWTGFFTSRPLLKRYVRAASAFLQASRQLALLGGVIEEWKHKQEKMPQHKIRLLSTDEGPTRELAEGVAVAQRHDAVTGTEMQHVAYDYALAIRKGWDKAAEAMGQALTNLVSQSDSSSTMPQLVQCPLAYNESRCEISIRVLEAHHHHHRRPIPLCSSSSTTHFPIHARA